jgi:hypothetical protein
MLLHFRQVTLSLSNQLARHQRMCAFCAHDEFDAVPPGMRSPQGLFWC